MQDVGRCERCSVEFVATKNGMANGQRYCSKRCRNYVNNKAWVERNRFIGPVPMPGDHTEIMSPLNWRRCAACQGEMLRPGGSIVRFCRQCLRTKKRSDELARYYRERRAREGYGQRPKTCAICGAAFVGHGGRAFCDSCPDARAAVYKQAPEPITIHELAQRDKGRCWLCGIGVDASDRTVDHVWPIAKGGKHIWSNVRLAHRRCNSRKGDRLVTAQIGLI